VNTDIIVFPELYRRHLPLLQKDSLLIVTGTVDKTEKGIKVIATDISPLDELENKREHRAEIRLRYPLPEHISLQELKAVVLSNGEGEYSLYLRIFQQDAETLIATGMKISPDRNTINKIEKIAGKGAIIVQ
jgi:DNA polymerase-3 subunit alpha